MSSRLTKVCRETDAERMLAGKLFHTRWPATTKLHVPSAVLVVETKHWLSADQRRRLPATVVTGTQSSARYRDATSAHVGTCRRLSLTCTWFDDGQEVSEVHATPVRCDRDAMGCLGIIDDRWLVKARIVLAAAAAAVVVAVHAQLHTGLYHASQQSASYFHFYQRQQVQ